MKWKIINILVVTALILVTGVQMRTGDMLEKLARGQKLSESDIATLRLKMNQQESVTNIWSGNLQGTQPSFLGKPEGAFATSDHPLIKILAGNQTIPEDEMTYLTFGLILPPDSIATGFGVDLVGDPTNITILQTGMYFIVLDMYMAGYDDGTIRQTVIHSSNTSLGDPTIASSIFVPTSAYNTDVYLSTVFYGAVGDKISVGFYHSRNPSIAVSAIVSLFMIRGVENK